MAWLLTWLVHGLVIALVTRFALRALPGLSAATRYAMWWAALVLVLILPIVRGLAIGAGAQASDIASDMASAGVAAPASPDAPGPAAVTAVSAAERGVTPAVAATPNDTLPAMLLRSAGPLLQSVAVPPVSLPRVPDWFLSIVIGLWLGTAMVGLAQLACSVQAVRRLKTSCRRMVMPRESDLLMWSAVRHRGRAVRVRASDRVRMAAVLGLTRPVIAVPRDAAAELTPHEIDQVVLHEYAHVQRYDDWTKLLQVLIGAFAGWHPAVRLMMREIDFEREAACDDYVVDVTCAPRAYARCLTRVIEMMPGSSLDLAAVPHAYSSASHATTRIERLLDRKRPPARLALMPAMAGSATLAVLAFCTVHALPIATDLPRASQAPTRGATLASAAAAAGRSADTGDDGAASMRDRDANLAAADAVGGDVVAVAGIGGDAASANASMPTTPRNRELRIAAASALPIDLAFSRFSPLSRLTDARLGGSRASRTATPGIASAATSPSTGLARADSADSAAANGASVGRNARAAGPAPAPASTSASASTPETRQARETPGGNGNASPAPTPAASQGYARDNRSGVGTHRPAATSDVRDKRDAATPPAEATFAVGPVVAAGDSDAMLAASEAGHIERAWENTRDATSKAMGVSARAVGSATRTAGGATKTATNKAAAGVKVGGTHTVRALGHVKRTLASVF